jgi:hypothetical protein
MRKGKYFDVLLKRAHINWGTESSPHVLRNRNEYEAYLPISMEHARMFNMKTGDVFNGFSKDGFFEGRLKATGSQGKSKEYAKNLYKDGDLRALGYWLIDRMNAKPGDTVRIEFIEEDVIELTLHKAI